MKKIQFHSYTDCLHSENYGYLYVLAKGIGIGNIGVKAYLEVHECGVDYDVTGPTYTPFSEVSYFQLKGSDLSDLLSGNDDAINKSFYMHFNHSRRLSYDEFQVAIAPAKSEQEKTDALHDEQNRSGRSR